MAKKLKLIILFGCASEVFALYGKRYV